MMHQYVHNPDIYRRHFQGKALPAFQGQRMQHGHGFPMKFMRRLASPLLSSMAPHVAGVASKLAKQAAKAMFPNSPLMYRVVGNVVRAGTKAAVRSVQKKPSRKKSNRVAPDVKAKRRRRIIVNKKRNIFKER